MKRVRPWEQRADHWSENGERIDTEKEIHTQRRQYTHRGGNTHTERVGLRKVKEIKSEEEHRKIGHIRRLLRYKNKDN